MDGSSEDDSATKKSDNSYTESEGDNTLSNDWEDVDSITSDYLPEFSLASGPEFSLTKSTVNWIILSLHLACALSRPAWEVSDIDILGYFSMICWLIYAFFVPGLVILFTRRRGALLNSDLILIPALSLSWIIFVGLLVQTLGWILEISNPLQWWTTGYISLFLTFLLQSNYDSRIQREDSITLTFEPPSRAIIVTCCIIILMSFCGPLLLNRTGSNFGTMLAIFTISLFPTIVDRGGILGDYLVIYFCSLSMILTHSLVSSGITGGDIQLEFFWANRVIEEGSIDILSNHRYSTILSTQIILPLLAMWADISLTSTLKIVYPVIYSFVPLLLYFSYSQVFSRHTSFFAALLTPFCFQFYVSMTNMPRQGFAEVFLLTALALLFSSDSIRMYRLRIYVVPMLFMMTLAHYGTPILLYPLLWTSYAAFITIDFLKPSGQEIEELLFTEKVEKTEVGDLSDEEEILSFQIDNSILLDEEGIATMEELQSRVIATNPLLNFRHLFFGSLFVVFWHNLAGGGVIIDVLQFIVDRVTSAINERGIWGAIFSTQPSETVTSRLQPFHQITKILYLILTALSVPAIIRLFSKENISRPERNALSLAIGSWILAALVFTVPFIALSIEFDRVYHWILMFLAPFTIQGVKQSYALASEKVVSLSNLEGTILPAIMCSYLLLSSGFVYQFTEEDHRMALDSEVEWARFSDSEEAAAIWYNSAPIDLETRQCIWADYHSSRLFIRHQGQKTFDSEPSASFAEMIFLDRKNLQDEEVWIFSRSGSEKWSVVPKNLDDIDPNPNFRTTSVVYDSGGSVWLSRENCAIDESFLSLEW